MAFGDSIQNRINLLHKKGADVPEILKRVQETATLRAIETAAEKTPPTLDDLKGINTRTGQLQEHWEIDSQSVPQVSENEYKTALANNVDYASYVNNGHRMSKHFVPGLIINPSSGLLEKSPDGKGGIMVGTKTNFVQGKFMREAALETYEEVLKSELTKELKELYENE